MEVQILRMVEGLSFFWSFFLWGGAVNSFVNRCSFGSWGAKVVAMDIVELS